MTTEEAVAHEVTETVGETRGILMVINTAETHIEDEIVIGATAIGEEVEITVAEEEGEVVVEEATVVGKSEALQTDPLRLEMTDGKNQADRVAVEREEEAQEMAEDDGKIMRLIGQFQQHAMNVLNLNSSGLAALESISTNMRIFRSKRLGTMYLNISTVLV